MDKLKFLQLVQNTEMLSPALRADLTDIAENYPYFQGVYTLLAKLNQNDQTINQAAIRTANRTVLKSFLRNEGKKKDKREIIANLDLHTDQVNAFEKFEDLEGAEENETEAIETPKEKEAVTVSEEVVFKDEVLGEEEIKDTSEETLTQEPIQNNEINQEETTPEQTDIPVFDEPDYFKTEQDLATGIKQEDTSKDIPEYKENIGANFFDALADEQFTEVNFEEKEEDLKESTNFFEQIDEEIDEQNEKGKAVEQEITKSENIKTKSNYNQDIQVSTTNIPATEFDEVDFEEINEGEFDPRKKTASNYGEEVPISSTNIPATEFDEVDFEEINEENFETKTQAPKVNGKESHKKVAVAKKKELSYTDYHLVAGEVLPLNTKKNVKKPGKSKEDIQYEDYHLQAPYKEVKITPPETKVVEKAPEVEKNNKSTDNFFDSF